MLLKIVNDSASLGVESEKIENITPAIRQLIVDMGETMKAKGGVGLSAIQVGLPIRLFLMETRDQGLLAIINPEIIKKEKRVKVKEECLSFPDEVYRVARYKRITVRFTDKDGNGIEKKLANIESRIFQHELDHLNGIIIRDKVK